MHEDVTAQVRQFSGHALAVVGQRLGCVKLRVDGADGARVSQVADQANGLAWDAQADGDFGAHRDKLEILAEGATAELGLFMPTVVAHFVAQQAGTDGDFRFVRGFAGHRQTSD